MKKGNLFFFKRNGLVGEAGTIHTVDANVYPYPQIRSAMDLCGDISFIEIFKLSLAETTAPSDSVQQKASGFAKLFQ